MSPVNRTAPHDADAEKSVIAALLLDPDAIIKVADILSADSFFVPAHAKLYDAMVSLYERRQPIDVVTLTAELRKRKDLQDVGGAAYLAELSGILSTTANVVQYAQMVADLYLKRRLITIAGEIGELGLQEQVEAKDALDAAEQKVFALSQKSTGKSFIQLKETLVESFDRIDELQRSPGGLRGVTTGFQDLDTLLAGMQKSNLLILAARPGMGKTAFALNMAHHAAVHSGVRVGIFSLEMSREELVDRLLVSQADIDAWKLKAGRLDQQDFLKLSDAMGVLADAKIYIDDSPGLSIFEMRTRARRLMTEYKIDMLMVDYLQLAHGKTQDNRVQEVAEISQGLKNIARELKIPVVALSQLNRSVESRGERVPQLSDLRESGSIEQDADVVMFLYRKDDEIRESVNLRIAKHRNGALGDIDLYFKGDRIKFYGMETRRMNP